MRWGNRNLMACVTQTVGTGPYLIGATVTQKQSPSIVPDGEILEGRVSYGTNWECGSYTKNGLYLERTKIYESSNGNEPVNWGAGDKIFSVTPLAENVAKSSDNSIQIDDDVNDGRTNFRGLKLSDVATSIQNKLLPGVDISISGDLVAGASINNLRKGILDADAATITLDLSAITGGSTHVVKVSGNRQLAVAGGTVGQEFLVKLDYDVVGGRVVKWWDDIKWVNGYEPAFTPVGGGSDTFKFQVVDVETIDLGAGPVLVYSYIGWIESTERPVIVELDTTPNVFADIQTIQQGAIGGPNEIQWLSATVDSDYMEFIFSRNGNVTGGTFDVTIQAGSGANYTASNIPFDTTATDFLKAIWTQTPYGPTRINVASGVNGALCGSRLTDVVGTMGIEFLGRDRYVGYVIGIDGANLVGGGSYQVSAIGTGSGSSAWILDQNDLFQPNDPQFGIWWPDGFKLEFNGQTTQIIPWEPSVLLGSHASQVQKALEALPNIGVGNIKVRQYDYGVYSFEFVGALRNQDISGEIRYAAAFLPQGYAGQATGQIYGTSQNGTGPLSYNEIQRLTIDGNPTEGYVILTIRGNVVNIPVDSTATDIEGRLQPLPGFYTTGEFAHVNVNVTGGPLPGAFVDIEFIEELGGQDISDSSVNTFSAGAAVIDHSICEGAIVLVASAYQGGPGSYRILHQNAIPGKTIHVTLKNEGSDFDAEFTTVTDGYPESATFGGPIVPGQDEIQRFTVTESPLPTSGFAVVKILGKRVQWAFNASSSEVETAINAELDSAGVIVTGGPLPDNPVDVRFSGAYKETNQPLSIVLFPAIGDIVWDGVNLAVDWDAALAPQIPDNRIDTYLEFYDEQVDLVLGKNWFHSDSGGGGLGGVRSLNAEVGDITLIAGSNITITKPTPNTIRISSTGGGGGGCIPQDEIQRVLLSGIPEGGTFTLNLGGISTSAIPWNVSAVTLISYLEALPSIGAGNVSCTGGPLPDTAIDVQFINTKGNQDISQMTGDSAGLTKPAPVVDVQTTQQGSSSSGTYESQEFRLFESPTGGTFTFNFGGLETGPLPFNCTAAQATTALGALANMGGQIACTGGPFPGNAIVGTFTNFSDQPQITIDPTNLTGGTISATITTTQRGSGEFDLQPIAYWKFEEGSGPRIDSVGGLVLTENAVIYGDQFGRVGGGIPFVTDNSRLLTSPDHDLLSIGNKWFAITLWFKPITHSGGNLRYLLYKSGLTQESFEYSLNFVTDGYVDFVYKDGVTGAVQNFNVGEISDLTFDEWHFIYVEHNPNSNKFRSSINNGAITEINHNTGIHEDVGDFVVGQFFNGMLDEFGIWDRGLAADEITHLYHGRYGQTYPIPSKRNSVHVVSVDSVGDTDRWSVVGNASVTGGYFTLSLSNDPMSPGTMISTRKIPFDASGQQILDIIAQVSEYHDSINDYQNLVVHFDSQVFPPEIYAKKQLNLGDAVNFMIYGASGKHDQQWSIDTTFLVGGTYLLSHLTSGNTQSWPNSNGYYRLRTAIANESTPDILASSSPLAVAYELSQLASIGLGNIKAIGGAAAGVGPYFFFEYVGNNSGNHVTEFVEFLTPYFPSGFSYAFTQELDYPESTSDTNEIQQLATTGNPSQGTFTLSWNGTLLPALPHNATTSQVITSLDTLGGPGAVNVNVTGGPLPTPIDIEFVGSLAATDVSEIVVDDRLLRCSYTTLVDGGSGGANTNEVQQVILLNDVTGGSFTLEFGGDVATIPFDATTSILQGLLEALPSIGSGGVSVSGSAFPNGTQTVTFIGSLAATNVQQLVGDATNLTQDPLLAVVITIQNGDDCSGSSSSQICGPCYTHIQSVPSTNWIISHNLGYYPMVNLIIGGEVWQPQSISYQNVNQAAVAFLAQKTGIANCY